MAEKFGPDEIVKGTVEYAVLTTDQKGEMQLEIGGVFTERILGDRPDDPTEKIPETDLRTWLYLGMSHEKAQQRRGIARDQIAKLGGVELVDDWEAPAGYSRLAADHPESILPQLAGKPLMLKSREYGGKTYWDLFFFRTKPKPMTLAEMKAKMAKPAPSPPALVPEPLPF